MEGGKTGRVVMELQSYYAESFVLDVIMEENYWMLVVVLIQERNLFKKRRNIISLNKWTNYVSKEYRMISMLTKERICIGVFVRI